jgi:hypothetical protein
MRPGVSEATLAGCGRLRDARDGTFCGRAGAGAGPSAGRRRPRHGDGAGARGGRDGASPRGCGVCGEEAARVTKTPRSQELYPRGRFRGSSCPDSEQNQPRKEELVRLREGSRPPRSRCVDPGPYRGPKVMSRVCNRGEVVNFTTSPSHPPRRSRRLRDGRPPRPASRHGPRPSPVPLESGHIGGGHSLPGPPPRWPRPFSVPPEHPHLARARPFPAGSKSEGGRKPH